LDYESPLTSAPISSTIVLAGILSIGITSVSELNILIDHTQRMIVAAGVHVERTGAKVSADVRRSLTATTIKVLGDISSAAFVLVAGAINASSNIEIKNVRVNPTRTGILDVLKKMGASLTLMNQEENTFEPSADMHVEFSALQGVEIGGDVIPRLIDEIP